MTPPMGRRGADSHNGPVRKTPGPGRRTPVLVAMTVAALAAVAVTVNLGATDHPAGALSLGGMSIQPSPSPAFDQDAPDPDVVLSGSTYYAFTTGTALGKH